MYAAMYAGMASGSNSAHCSTDRPGNSNIVTSQAVTTPMIRTPAPTPMMSSRVSLT